MSSRGDIWAKVRRMSMLWSYRQAVRSSLSKMLSCAIQVPGRQQVCFSGSGFWPNRWDGGRGGNSNVHLLCWCSLENSHSGPHLPISQHFLTPYCIPKPVLGTKIPRNMEKRYPKRLSVKRKTRVCFKGLPWFRKGWAMQESNWRDAMLLGITKKTNGPDSMVWLRSGRQRCCRTSRTSAEGWANLEKRRTHSKSSPAQAKVRRSGNLTWLRGLAVAQTRGSSPALWKGPGGFCCGTPR